ncbi:MAG TPA: polyphenol oxidase family protein, partial [Bacillales bacterium]|nr:polyphenol oxidase family protein [Bacillales bacterium]
MNGEPFAEAAPSFMKIACWPKEVTAGFSTRNGGTSVPPFQSLNLGYHVEDEPDKVLLNRKHLAERLSFPMQQWICAEQIHGSAIRKVDEGEAGNGSLDMNSAIPGTDGLYTNAKGILLALAYADCVPLYFFAPRSGFVGIAHAGWRGTVQNIGGFMVERWVRNQSIPIEDIHVAIGPSIGPCCYEVDYRVIEAVGEALEPDVDQVCRPVSESHF